MERFGHNDQSYVWRKKGRFLNLKKQHYKIKARRCQRQLVGVVLLKKGQVHFKNKFL